MTGAPMPPGADAVVPIEDATEDGGRVAIPGVVVGRFVRAAGHDTRAGEVVALPPEPMTPSVIAVVASLGVPEVAVRARPRVAVLSTGDELVEPGRQLQPGQIHDANSVALAAAVREAGGEPVPLPRVGDDPEAIEEAIGQAVARADLLVVSGGVSVGRHDHVRDVIERLGSLELWRIAVQPGKPLAFGRIGEVPVVGLPGNPVSALVTFELFVRPLLRAMLGLSGDGRQRVRVRVAERLAKDPERRAYLRVLVSAEDGRYVATSAGGQASSQLRPLAAANALLVVPEGLEATVPGETYDALLFGGLT
jgi:molybdopterin molybdotransferase